MKASQMWSRFAESVDHSLADVGYDAWEFGDSPDELAELVKKGIKTATSSAYDIYALEGEPLPKEGEYSVILDSRGDAVCVIKTTRVYVTPFDEVGEEHAYKEGEGDKSLSYWRKVHERFFSEELLQAKMNFNQKIQVVCEEFEVVYK